ncbi:MAG: hypothetical protein CMO20_04590 [Thermoplasmata archaeon]|nr:hypothetical protein [Thermoplasmata archaeon]|tara:strand:+ start:638 stop:1228 length:591 start_codon:yes stop_codon:yes gene_type:complete
MAISTTVVIIISALAVLLGAISKTQMAASIFSSLGASDEISNSASRRLSLGSLSSIVGGTLSAVWIWAIQRQEVVGVNSLCSPTSGCTKALSDPSFSSLPFTNLEFGLFFVLLFSIIGYLMLSVYLDPKLTSARKYIGYSKMFGLLGSLISIIMLVYHLAMVEGSPALCPLCLILVGANVVTLFQLFMLDSFDSIA